MQLLETYGNHHVLYFRKAGASRISNMILWGGVAVGYEGKFLHFWHIYVAKAIYALLAHFCRKNNLRTPSGKFLRVKFCRPESFDFLCLCHQYNILIVSEMSPIGPNCREVSVCFGFGVELHYNELGWVSQERSADQNSSSSIFRETKIFISILRCSYNRSIQRSYPTLPTYSFECSIPFNGDLKF